MTRVGVQSSLGGRRQAANSGSGQRHLPDAAYRPVPDRRRLRRGAGRRREGGSAEVRRTATEAAAANRATRKVKAECSSANRLIVAILVVAALAIGFWMLAAQPQARGSRRTRRPKSRQLQRRAREAAEPRSPKRRPPSRTFPADYRQLVVLGQAVPAGDETSSLLVELNRSRPTSKRASSTASSSTAERRSRRRRPPTASARRPRRPASGAVPAAATVPPTEAAASLLPLGATIGPAGLGVMPYTLTFTGSFFDIADFIKGIDSLVDTRTTPSRRRRPPGDAQRLLAQRTDEGGVPRPQRDLLGHHLPDAARPRTHRRGATDRTGAGHDRSRRKHRPKARPRQAVRGANELPEERPGAEAARS